MSNENKLDDKNVAPVNACILNENVEQFADGDGGTKNKFRIIGYSGAIIKNHWFWGNLAIDLSGCKFYKKRLPVLEEHFKAGRLGFTTKQTIEEKVIVEGEYLTNDNAKAMQADIDQGFPMEASLFCPPSVIERVMEGASVQVNGHTLNGPGAVFRKSTIKEVSMCVFGADSNTKSSALSDMEKVKFNSIQENDIMAGKTEITSLEIFNEQCPDLFKELFEKGKAEGVTEGEQNVRASFGDLQTACGDDHQLVVECFSQNKTVLEAKDLLVGKLKAANVKLSETNTELQTATAVEKVDPANAEFKDKASPEAPNVQEESGGVDEDALKAEFAADANLQGEFGNDFEAYAAFKKADKGGQVRVLKAPVTV